MRIKYVSTTLVVTGTGDAQIEAEIAAGYGGLVRGYRFRRTAGSGTPPAGIFTRTGQTEASTDYNLVAPIAALAVSTAPTLPDPPIPFANEDDTEVEKLYFVAENDGGGGDASTWVLVMMIEEEDR